MRWTSLRIAIAATLAVGLASSSCSSEEEAQRVISEYGSEADAAWLVSGDAAFALGLYGRLAQRQGNLFFSPHSVYTALSMTYMGARGETESQMTAALGLSPATSGNPESHRGRVSAAFGALSQAQGSDLSSGAHVFAEANGLWCQTGYPFLDAFLALNRDGFGAEVSPVDFARDADGARATINQWVEERTLGKIEDLIGPGDLDQLVRIVLTNAVYFKGLWATQFDPRSTRDASFHPEPGNAEADVIAPMMSRKGDYSYARIDGAGLQIIELPYEGGRASMLVLLPDEDVPGGVGSIEARLLAHGLDEWLPELHDTEILVSLPRFEMTWGTEDIIPELRLLGITDLFSDGADLSGIDGTKELYVSRVLHKAFVEVNEEGTEAAAATAVIGRLKASMPLEFRADRPFLFLIRDVETGVILFMGRLMDPTA